MEELKKKIVVYTAVFGGYSDILPQKVNKNIDFICFTDKPEKLKNRKPWKIFKVEPPIKNDSVRSNRYFKLHPHKYFKDYDYSIYVDSNYLIIGDVIELINQVLKDNYLACFDHNQTIADPRNCIYDEYKFLKELYEKGNKKGDPAKMDSYIEKLKKEGYPKNNGLIFAGVLLRKHNDEQCIKFMESWFKTVLDESRRDQLSFNYIAWKHNFKFYTIKGDLRRGNPWFFLIGEHRKKFSKKIFTYKLKRLIGIIKHPKNI
ncbi:MAG: DUF616 domain-containing protein [Flavobacteriales bacterium]|nr:DUF616 domain-containing protein [Flavobacteriales bacterium]